MVVNVMLHIKDALDRFFIVDGVSVPKLYIIYGLVMHLEHVLPILVPLV